jgi:hypothetical protein
MDRTWLRGPLRPLSESILSSGLVRDSHITVKSDTPAIPSRPNRPSTVAVPAHPHPSKPQLSKSKFLTDAYNILSLKPPSRLPQPQILPTYRPPPLTPDSLAQRITRADILHDTAHAEKQIFLSETRKRTMRESVRSIESGLDGRIAAIMSTKINIADAAGQARLKNELLDVYNYALNEIILQEKENCVDRALLLRRLHDFYNQLVSDVPTMGESFMNERMSYENKIAELTAEVHSISSERDEIREVWKATDSRAIALEADVQKLTEETNEKDILLSSTMYDLEYAKGQVQRLTFKLTAKREKRAALKKAIVERDAEVQRQLAQIDQLEKQLSQWQQGETGYIVKYREEIETNGKLRAEIQNLQLVIENISNIQKFSIAVDTSDLPKKSSKSKGKGRPTAVRPVGKGGSILFAAGSLASAKGLPTIDDDPEPEIVLPQETESPVPRPPPVDLTDADSQTDPVPSPEPVIVEVVKEVPIAVQTARSEATRGSPMALGKTVRRKATVVAETDYELQSECPFDPSKIDSVPDLHCVVMPFMSTLYAPPQLADVRMLTQATARQVAMHRKPVIWSLQTIHNFFCDPFMRSLEIHGKSTIETVVLNWLGKQLRISHLVTSAVANLAYAITEYRTVHPLVDLFAEMIEGIYSLSQVCFIATVYAFSCGLAYPNLIEMLSRMDIDPTEFTVVIDIRIAHALLTKSLSPDFSGEFLAPKVDPENPLLNYFTFLREIGVFFGEKHKMIYFQAKNLLSLCGTSDHQLVSYELFEHFMAFLSNEKHLKEDWRNALKNSEVRGSMIKFPELLTICAERREVLLELVTLPPLSDAAKTLTRFPPHIRELHRGIVSRLARVVLRVFSKWTEMPPRVAEIRFDLRQALLSADISRGIWFYRMLIIKLDRLIMTRKGSIPFSMTSSPEVIGQLVEYIDRTESVAFALLDE